MKELVELGRSIVKTWTLQMQSSGNSGQRLYCLDCMEKELLKLKGVFDGIAEHPISNEEFRKQILNN